MALKDRISIDQTGITAQKRDALLKGIAYSRNITLQNGDLDISNPSLLVGEFQQAVETMLVTWAKSAQDYERDRAANEVDISDA